MRFRRMLTKRRIAATCIVLLLLGVAAFYQEGAVAQKADGQAPDGWVGEIEQVFIRSEECKQCHDRHYEEMEGRTGTDAGSQNLWPGGRRASAAPRWSRRCFVPCWACGCRPIPRRKNGSAASHAMCQRRPCSRSMPKRSPRRSCRVSRRSRASGAPPAISSNPSKRRWVRLRRSRSSQGRPCTVPMRIGGEPRASGCAVAALPGRQLLRLLSFRQGQGRDAEGFTG